MKCMGSVSVVKKDIKAIDGVYSVFVNLQKKTISRC